ncbi:MAG: ATP-binding protein [Gemmatales bacterium]|nr:ATP-binding protein [Gemmatales bacterium]MDW8387687.1 ATP-binding protein [Gemmatales bacterium]
MSENRPLILSVPSQCGYLPIIRAFIESACRTARFDDKFTQGLALAVHEAVANVICHAHRDRPEAPLVVECYLRHDAVEVRIYDEGTPFDLASVPHLDPGEVRIGGRGVFLIRSLVDELTCQPRGPEGNILRLVKRRRRAESGGTDVP